MIRRIAGVVLGLLVVAGLVAVGYAVRLAGEPDAAPPTTIATETTPVVRTDLVQTQTLSGTVEFSTGEQVRTGLPGTITALPAEAGRLGRGDTAFEIDGRPVLVLLGERPAWRPLERGIDDGPDVRQLEENLAALGYGPEDWEIDDDFDSDTAEAVEDWREEVGLPEGGGIELGRVIFVPAEIRVGAVLVEPGQVVAAGTPVFESTATEQQVTIDLDPDDIELVSEDDPAVVVLPDGERIDGRIAEIGRVVTPAGPEPDAPGILEVVVEVPPGSVDFDRAPVDVEVESSRAEGVLAVPVRALIALSDGGYAVQVGERLVGVETGEFAGGLVEISGAVEEGDEVVVPR